MKLSNLRIIGRFINPETGRPVNVHKGRRPERGTDCYFFLRSGARIIIGDAEFHGGEWKKAPESKP